MLSLARPVQAPRDHVVTFYDEYADVYDEAVEFLAGGLLIDEQAVVVTTHDHREALEHELGRHIDLDRARTEGRFVAVDVATTLAAIRAGGRVDRSRFRRSVATLLEEAKRGERPVRAFGELAGVVWDAGDRWEAIRLEALWNEVANERPLSIRCTYSMASLHRSGDLRAVNDLCGHHSEVGVPASYRSDDASRGIDAVTRRSELFIADPLVVRAVRRFVVAAVSHIPEEEAAGGAALVASELAENVVQHVGSPFRVTVRTSRETITIAVEDLSPEQPVRLDPAVDLTAGRGLTILDAMCARWGTDVGRAGKVVWAELQRLDE